LYFEVVESATLVHMFGGARFKSTISLLPKIDAQYSSRLSYILYTKYYILCMYNMYAYRDWE